MNRSSCVLSPRCASVDRIERVSTSCKQTIAGSGLSEAMACAIRRIDVRVLARPRVEWPKYRTL